MTVIISILLVVITFLLYKIFYLKRENIVKEIKKNAIILDKPMGLPKYSDVDKNLDIIRDTITSIEAENWSVVNFKLDDGCYDIDLLNPSRTIRTKFRIRLYDRTSLLYNDIILSWFTILKINGSSNSHAISFSNDDILAKAIILEYMWKYVIEYHEKLGSEAIEHYLSCKNAISKEFKTLNRDRQLNLLVY